MRPALLSFVFALLAGCNLTSNQVSVLDDSGDIAPDKLTAVLASYEARLDALELENAALRTDLETALAAKADQEDLDVLDGRVEDLEADAATATTDIGDLQARVGSVETAAAANTADIATNAADIGALTADLATLDAGSVQRIETDTTIDVPGTFDGVSLTWLDDALDLLDGYAVDRDAVVTIQLGAGYAETRSTPIVVAHPEGDRVEILGDFDATTTEFVFDLGSHGFVVEHGNALGLLDGVALEGLDTSDGDGVRVILGAHVQLGPDVTLTGFEDGVVAVLGASVVADGVTSDAAGYAGFRSTMAFLDADGAVATGAGQYGFLAQKGGALDAQGAEANQCRVGVEAQIGATIGAYGTTAIGDASNLQGFVSKFGAHIYAPGSESSSNGGSGYYALNLGAISAEGSSSHDNGGFGYIAVDGSFIDLTNHTTPSNNASGSYSAAVSNSDAWIVQ